MSYLIAKTLHLLCVFAWFAGLTYLPRLLVAAAAVEPQAHAERQAQADQMRLQAATAAQKPQTRQPTKGLRQ